MVLGANMNITLLNSPSVAALLKLFQHAFRQQFDVCMCARTYLHCTVRAYCQEAPSDARWLRVCMLCALAQLVLRCQPLCPS
jgi:hypothetical protein